MKAPIAVALAFAAVAAGVVTWQSQGADSFTYTFDGTPGTPQSMYGMADFDVQVHHRDMHRNDPDMMEGVDAHHGPNGEPPGHDGGVTHFVQHYSDTVFQCADHVMTAMGHHAYAVIYLTPDRLLDWSDGEATMTIDVSTLKTSNRDWWDIWLQEWDGHLALPLSYIYPDLQGRPTTGEWMQLTSESSNERVFIAKTSATSVGSTTKWQNQSAQDRDTFVLTINKTTFSFCKPDESICFMEDAPHGLTMTQAVVSLGHHDYTSKKDGGTPNTWHWDNLFMSDSVPFTIIRTSPRSMRDSGALCFDSPAPADAYLRFSAMGVTHIDGVLATEVPAERPLSGTFASYMHPIEEGTECVTYSGTKDWSGSGSPTLKDASVFSLSTGVSPEPTATAPASPIPPTNTPSPTNTPVPPTATPTGTSTPTVVSTSTSTSTPLPTTTPTATSTAPATATNTPMPEPTATATATSTPTPEPDVCHQAYYLNGVLTQGPEIACP